jgi:hypothetical protein
MPISQGNFSSGPFGLTMRAWGLLNGLTGALISGQGVASSARVSAGNFTFVLSSAASAQAVVIARGSNTTTQPLLNVGGAMTSTTNGQIMSWTSSVASDVYTDPTSIHFEVWA